MSDDEPVELAAVAADAEAIDDALAAFEEACAQLTHTVANAMLRPHARRHLAAVGERLAASVPVTAAARRRRSSLGLGGQRDVVMADELGRF